MTDGCYMVLDDKRYSAMILRDGEYVPDVGMAYPVDDPYVRLMPSDKVRDLKFDTSYPFIDDSLRFRIQRHFAYFLVFGPFYLVNWLKFGLKYKGRSVLWKYRKEIRKGLVSVSNHCYRWDGMAISEAVHHRLWIPMLADHFNGRDHWYLTYFGGIPLSDGSYAATKMFNDAFDTHHARKAWIHVFPEARNWLFYKPLRPFRKGAFTWAYKWGVPVLPIALSYRPRTGIHKLFAPAEVPLITVNIGEPIFPDTSKPRRDEVMRLLTESHRAVCRLAGIETNSWPEVWAE